MRITRLSISKTNYHQAEKKSKRKKELTKFNQISKSRSELPPVLKNFLI